MNSIQAAAAAGKQTAGLPLQEDDDGHQDDNLSRDRRTGGLLEDLVGGADAKGRADGADDAAHAAQTTVMKLSTM